MASDGWGTVSNGRAFSTDCRSGRSPSSVATVATGELADNTTDPSITPVSEESEIFGLSTAVAAGTVTCTRGLGEPVSG